MIKKYLRPALFALASLLALSQFFQPAKNQSSDRRHDIALAYAVPNDVAAILKSACNDCHSNYTVYPWYAEVQPVASWIAHHVEEGREHLNFDAFTAKRIAVQHHKLEEIAETVAKHEMPMQSYAWLHPDAALTEAQRTRLVDWANAQMDTLKARYPADSLVLKR